MAYSNARFGYHQPQADAEINSKPPHFFTDNDSSVLENALLGADIMQTPDAAAQMRGKGPYVNTSAIVSPHEAHPWTSHYGTGLPVDPASAVSASYHDDHHAFAQEPTHQSAAFGHTSQPQTWPFEQASGECTPTNRMDFEQPPAAPAFDAQSYAHQRTDSARGSFSHAPRRTTFNGPEEGFIPAPQVQTPMSPHSHQDWMSMAAQEVECRPHSRRMRGGSPAQTTVDFQRRDGIRKKNARIDIPQERSIQTIEHMLETVTDEDTLKELKQQKRLLRNREAALASRQRKKKHTEDLELREKDFGRTIDTLQAQLDTQQLERQNYEHSHQILNQRLQEATRIIESLQEEKRDIMLKHTEETSTLRKRIRVLTDQIENELAPAMSTVPSSTGFADFNAEMEALNMGAHDWDSLIFSHELHGDGLEEISFDSKPEPSVHPAHLDRPDASAATGSMSSKHGPEGTSDQHVTQGLLFFLLLCGAFVASRPSSLQPSDLPQVPADVRAAAPKVLNNLLYESQSSSATNMRTSRMEASEPSPSSLVTVNTRPRSRLDRMTHRLTAPTKQQEIDSAFSLTTAEYASITNMDYPLHDERPSQVQHEDATPRPRRSLADTLADMQDDSTRSSKAEVYTRSLLWDQIPADVVKQFKELVRDHNDIEARQHQQQQRQDNDDMIEYKLET